MAKCDFCGKEVAYPYKCRYCGGIFCEDHRLPPNHNCINIDLWRMREPPPLSRRSHSEGVLLKPYPHVTPPANTHTYSSSPRKKRRNIKAWIGAIIFLIVAFAFATNFLNVSESPASIPSQPSLIKILKLTPIITSTPATLPEPTPTPTPVNLREKLWRYELKYALEVALSSSELSKIQDLANELKGEDICESAWNLLEWEDKNIEYDHSKASLPAPLIYYEKDPYTGVITDVEVVGGKDIYYYQTPYETVKKGKGVCSDYAILTAALLLAMDYSPVYIFHINYENYKDGHVATAIKVDGQYFMLDQHLPVWDLSDYYYHWFEEEGKRIKNATVYAVYKGEEFASVRKVEELTSDDFKKYAYKIKQSELRALQLDLINEFEERFRLKRDYSLYDLDERDYLPSGYSYGKIWTLRYHESFYHPKFQKCFVNYVLNRIKENEKIMEDVLKCNRFWIKAYIEDEYLVIKLMLTKR